MVVELFQNGDMDSCDFGAEQVVLVRDEATKVQVTSLSGNKALVLTVLEAKGMEFTDCLVYNFFESSPLKNCWRVVYNAMLSSPEPRPAFDTSKHSGLCVELKLLYVLLTRARQHLVIFDEDIASRKPMLDYWCELGLVQCKPLDEDIRSVFLTVSTPAEWNEKGNEFFERKQYRNACMCFHRAGDEYNERMCHAFELEQDAEKIVVRHPHDAHVFYRKAGSIFEQLGRHWLEAAARCFEAAREYKKSAEIYLALEFYKNAAWCFCQLRMWIDAAAAYQNCEAVNKCLSACYSGYHYDRVLDHIMKFKSRDVVDCEEATKLETVCMKKAAIHHHGQADKTQD